MQTPEELKDAAIVNAEGMSNSVMDYPSINFARDKKDQTKFLMMLPAPMISGSLNTDIPLPYRTLKLKQLGLNPCCDAQSSRI